MVLQIVKVAQVQHRSPFRYPGGKTWLVPFIQQWVLNQPKRLKQFIESFAGTELDLERLFSIVDDLEGDFLMTYDNAPEIQVMTDRYGFSTKTVAMKNTHHAEMRELLVGRGIS